jgi:sugar phosphate permease
MRPNRPSDEVSLKLTRRPAYRWIVLAMAFFGVFGAIGFGRFGYSAILPSMQKALGISSAAAGSLASWNLAGYTLSAAVGGVLASRIGPRKVLTVGIVLTAAGMLVTGVSSGLLTASVGRLVTGLGNGMILVPSITLMAAWFDVRRLGFASSVVPTGSSLALMVAGPAVPQIVAAGGAEGWRIAWYFFAGIAIVLAALNVLVQRDRPYDLASMRGQMPVHYPRTTPATRTSTRLRETRRESAGAELMTILRSGYAWHLGAVYTLYGVAFLSYFTFFQKRLTADLDYSPAMAGNLFIVLGAAGLIGGVIWGMVSDRIGRRLTIAATMLLAGIGGFLFAWGPNAAVLVVSAILFGSTGVPIPGLIGAACGDRFGALLASTALGLLTVLVGVGQAIGPLLGGFLADASGSFASNYYLSACAFLVGAVAALLLPHRKRRSRP